MTILSQTKTASNVSMNPNLLDYETSLTLLKTKFVGDASTVNIVNNPDGTNEQVLEIVSNGTWDYSQAYINTSIQTDILYGVTTGDVVTLSADIYVPESTGLNGPGATNGRISIRYRVNNTNAVVLSDKATSMGEWQRLSLTFTVPANIQGLNYRLGNGWNVAGKNVFYKNVKLEHGSTANPFNPGESGATLTHTPWTNTSNANTCDTNNTSANITAESFSRYLHANKFDFNIPQSSIIHGIKIEAKSSAITADKLFISHSFLGYNYEALNDISQNSTYFPVSATDLSLGGATELWGLNPHPDTLNSESFGVLLRVQNTDTTDRLGYIDCVKATIYYEVVETDLQTSIITNPVHVNTEEYLTAIVTVKNLGTYTANTVSTLLTLDSDLEYVYDSVTNGTYDSTTKTWTKTSILPGATSTLQILLKAKNDETYTLTAETTTATTDPNPANNTDTATLTVTPWTLPGATYGFRYRNQHSSEYGIITIDHPTRNIRSPTNDVLTKSPGMDGAYPIRQDNDIKTVQISFKVVSDTPESLRVQLEEIGMWLRTDRANVNTPVLLDLFFDDELEKRYHGYFTDEISVNYEYNLAHCTATFIVPSGTVYNRVRKITGPTGNNTGATKTPCKIYITTENQESLIVTNSQTGAGITIFKGFGDGEEVIIDTEKKTITSTGIDIRAYASFNTSFFKLDPGSYTIGINKGVIQRVEYDERYY